MGRVGAGAPSPENVTHAPPFCLHSPRSRPTPLPQGAAELLVARGFALLLMLSECEEPSYVDAAARHAATRRVSEHIINRSAAYIGQARRLLSGGLLGATSCCFCGASWPISTH